MSGDSVVISSVAYPDPRKLALVADMQYHEPYTSAALNRKLRGILREGFYTGFIPRPGGGLNLLVTSVDSEQKTGSASINIGDDYQITVRQQKDVILKLSAGTKFAIILKAVYTLGSDTYQVNSKSSIKATEIYAKTFTDSYELGDGELLICTVNIPAGAKEITIDMIDSTAKKVAAIGIELSNDFNSDEEKKAATPKAVKDGIADHEQKADPHSQYAMKESPVLTGTPEAPTASAGTNTNQIANTAFVQTIILGLIGGSPETLSTLEKIADAINNDPNFSTTISNKLALKAPLDSPLLTGAPSAPTAPEDTNNTQIATTAFVRRAISALVGSAPETLDTINEIATALGNDPNFATTMLNALGGKQPLDNTLTNLSGKDVAGLLAYLGLGETINQASGALQKDQNGGDIPDKDLFVRQIGAARAFNGAVTIGGDANPWTTAEFIVWLESQGAFNHPYWMCRGTWSYALNKVITDTGCGNICLAGAVIEVMGVRGAMTVRVTTPTTTSGGGVASAQFTYINNGDGYAPGWRREFSRTGDEMTGNLYLKNDGRVNFCIMNEDGTPRMWLFKDKGGDGIHINNGNDGGGDYVFHKDGSFYAPLAVRAGGSKKLAVRSDNNSALSAHFNLWGDANRPTVIELDDDQGWHLYSQRNTDGSVVFYVNGDIHANTLGAGAAIYANNGDVFGTAWGGGNAAWLSSYLYSNMVKAVRLGPVALSGGLWRDYQLGGGQVVTGFHTDGSWEMEGGDDKVYYRPVQYLVGVTWVTAPSV
ncbi:tail fiber protein [Salmonella enterica]